MRWLFASDEIEILFLMNERDERKSSEKQLMSQFSFNCSRFNDFVCSIICRYAMMNNDEASNRLFEA